MFREIITNGVMVSGSADNDVATATADAQDGVRNAALGFIASFDAAVAAIKTITTTYVDEQGNTKTIVVDWNFANGPCALPFPGIVHTGYGQALTCALAASGTGGITGRIYLFYASI